MQSKFLKFTVIFIFSCFFPFPASAEKPASYQYLLAGPIPVNQLSSTEVFSCNVKNLMSPNSINIVIELCVITDQNHVGCYLPEEISLESRKSVQRSISVNPNDMMMFCQVRYKGQPDELTGTACMLDTTIGSQTCLSLQNGRYQGVRFFIFIPLNS